MNLFLCLFLVINNLNGYSFIKRYLSSENVDKIDLVRYYGKTMDQSARVEIHITASCSTCKTNYMSAISLKDENNKILQTFQYSKMFTGSSVAVMEIDEEVLKNNKTININCTVTFPKNKVQADQIQKLNFTLENVESTSLDINKNLLSYRKKCPYFIEKQKDGSMIKLYESYAFTDAIEGDFKLDEIDIRELSFQYSDSSLNDIPIYYGNAYLLIDDIFKGSDIQTMEGSYYFPLDVTCKEYKCNFSFLKNYYFDYNLDNLYETYMVSRVATKNLKLPSTYDTNKKIPFKIVLENVGAYGDEIIINGQFKVSYKLFGTCDNSKYCVGKTNEIQGEVEYEQTIEISS